MGIYKDVMIVAIEVVSFFAVSIPQSDYSDLQEQALI
tara:strand:+ start:725 stop:835 length:111 start_codon:yes stop_codon:yes gene_type:complete